MGGGFGFTGCFIDGYDLAASIATVLSSMASRPGTIHYCYIAIAIAIAIAEVSREGINHDNKTRQESIST